MLKSEMSQLRLVLLWMVIWMVNWPLTVAAYCSWPSFLQADVTWRNAIRNGGSVTSSVTTSNIAVDGAVLNFRYEDAHVEDFLWSCESPVLGQDGVYLVSKSSLEDPSPMDLLDPIEYLCVRFIQRGSDVIQLEASASWLDVADVNECRRVALQHVPWLLIKDAKFTTSTCPFVGGYDLRFFDKTMKEYCPGVYNPARLESKCDRSENIVLNFQDCPHNRLVANMQRHQTFECLIDWVQDGYMFIILMNQERSGFWVLRLPADFASPSSHNIEAVLFSDVVFEPTSADRITSVDLLTIMHMQHVMYTDICEDASPACTEGSIDRVCAHDNMFGHIFCKRTCGACVDQPEPCEFSHNIMTAWRPIFMRSNMTNSDLSRSTLFSIASDYVEIGQYGHLQCVHQDNYFQYSRYALVDYQHNGCAPRFHCLLIDTLDGNPATNPISYPTRHGHHNERLVAYKMEEGAIWPDYEESFYCNARMVTSQTPETPWDFAVSGSRRLKPSVCNFTETGYQFHQEFHTAESCEGTLKKTYCTTDSTLFTVSSTKCTNPVHERSLTYSCLSTFEHHHSEAAEHAHITLIQPSELPNHDYMCLVIQPYPKPVLMLQRRECLEFYFYESESFYAKFDLTPDESLCAHGPVAYSGGENSGNIKRPAVLLFIILLCIQYATYII